VRSINLGIITQQPTTLLTVILPCLDETATAQLMSGADHRCTPLAAARLPSGGMQFQAPLAPGHHVLVVDSTIRPGEQGRFTVTTDSDVTFWSAERGRGTPRLWIAGTGRLVVETDPKDPWPTPALPRPLPPALASSPIMDTMRSLLDANSGRGVDPVAPAPKTFALLIGIDHYGAGAGQGDAVYSDLQGCVSDVLEIKQVLESRVSDLAVTCLLSPRADGPGHELAVAPVSVPTYRNIVAAWRAVTEAAVPGDIVYIHYSGHGGRVKTRFPGYKSSGVDESLVPCDINDREAGRYLRDVEIALLLRRMAERELNTIFVIDSCHSGSATRGDQARPRTCDDHRPDLATRGPEALDSAVGSDAELLAIAQQLAHSPSDAAWHIDARGPLTSPITVIAACRQTEFAYEYSPDKATPRGALSYFWQRALSQHRGDTTYRQLYDQVFGDVHNVFTAQTPVLLGEPFRVALGAQVIPEPPAIRVSKVTGDQVELDAGALALIGVGAHLALVPPDRIREVTDLAQMVQVTVTAVSGTRALARRIPGAGGDAAIEVGATAFVRSYAPRMQRAVRLHAPPPVHDALAAAIAADPTKLLAVATGDGADFQVLVDPVQLVAEIADPGGLPLPYVPTTPIAIAGAVQRIVDQLVHLARFHNVLTLTNSDPNASLAHKVTAELLALPGFDPGQPELLDPQPQPPGALELTHGDYCCLRITNRSARPLALALLDLRPDWSISLLTPDGLDLDPGEQRDIALSATVPGDAYASGRDVLKVLATRDPVDGSLLKMPALGEPWVPRGPRGPDDPPLEELMRILQEPLQARRNADPVTAPSSGWTVVQAEFVVHRAKAVA
jgi:hypothetical protein